MDRAGQRLLAWGSPPFPWGGGPGADPGVSAQGQGVVSGRHRSGPAEDVWHWALGSDLLVFQKRRPRPTERRGVSEAGDQPPRLRLVGGGLRTEGRPPGDPSHAALPRLCQGSSPRSWARRPGGGPGGLSTGRHGAWGLWPARPGGQGCRAPVPCASWALGAHPVTSRWAGPQGRRPGKALGSRPGWCVPEGLLGPAQAPCPSFPTGGGRGLRLWECEPSSVNSW